MITRSIKRLWVHLAPRRKKQLAMLLVMMVTTSLTEVITISAVLPFLGALMSPEKIFTSSHMQPLVKILQISEPNQLILPLTLLFIAGVLVAAGMRLALVWAQIRLSNAIGADLSIQMYEKTLFQPYSVHVSRNSSQVIAGISGKANSVVTSAILPLLTALSSGLMLVVIVATLVVIDPPVAIVIFGSFGMVYVLIMASLRKQLLSNSQRISHSSDQVIKALQEGLGGIRDVLIDSTQAVYCKIYRQADLSLRRARANNQIIGASPRFVIEALGISLIAALAYMLASGEGGGAAAIPLLGTLAIGAQRLLPVMQQLYGSWSAFRGDQASLLDVLQLIEQPLPAHSRDLTSQSIPFENTINLVNVYFSYTKQSPWALRDINLKIVKGSRIGIVGTTGSGKSTLLDIIMALLQPSEGVLLIDETPINEKNFKGWQSHIAHVPQSIFLADATISENIALGVPPELIDYKRVEKAAKQAEIAATIESLEKGYNTIVGERGVRLSGGERQRIGIARALYKQADVIVFDEATSALDNETETAVMASVNSITDRSVTLFLVAHRLSSLQGCDLIYKIEGGSILNHV
ncbi:MdlB ABC-type multidrug transport system, ATPase and permease components [Burkholderiales bacterium]